MKTAAGKTLDIHNQIDYIFVPQGAQRTLTNARSYRSPEFESDHSLVLATLNTSKYYYFQAKQPHTLKRRAFDLDKLRRNEDTQEDYQLRIQSSIEKQRRVNRSSSNYSLDTRTPNQISETIEEIVFKAAERVIPKVTKTEQRHDKTWDDHEIHKLHQKYKRLARRLFKRGKNGKAKKHKKHGKNGEGARKYKMMQKRKAAIGKMIKKRIQKIVSGDPHSPATRQAERSIQTTQAKRHIYTQDCG